MGESTTRSQSPYDPAIHTMEEVDVTASTGDNAVGGVGAWAPPDNGEGMDLDSVTDMAGAGDSARSGVGGLGSGQVRLGEDRAVLSAADGASAWPSVECVETVDVVGNIVQAPGLADFVASVPDSPSSAPGDPARSFNHKQRRAWLRDQNRKGSS